LKSNKKKVLVWRVSFSEIASVSANVSTYTDTSATSGTYYYRIKARNSAGDSDYSNTADATVVAPADPCDSTIASSGYNSDDSSVFLATVATCGILIK
jgi:ABC-type ATPase with predicted acetyltransferase domain